MLKHVLLFFALLPWSSAIAAEPPASVTPETPGAAITDARTHRDYEALRKLADGHPNELYRIYAVEYVERKQYAEAARMFRIAARYADKYSQHRLSMLHWHGVGMSRDRVQGYIWADLAAERGYPEFLAIREKMWSELDASERDAVLRQGPALYAQYGDPVAKPRFARALGAQRRQTTGSHTGFVGNLAVLSPGPGQNLFNTVGGIDLATFYAQSRWNPRAYWRLEDALWTSGSVRVGDLETIPPSVGAKP